MKKGTAHRKWTGQKRMTKLLTTLSILLIATACYAQTYTVERVIDGDTLKLTNGERVRLIGIDTPESKPNDKAKRDIERTGQDLETITKMGQKVTEYVKRIIKPGQEIRLDFDVQEKDKHGRLLAYVYRTHETAREFSDVKLVKLLKINPKNRFKVYEIFVNAEIISLGYAQPMTIPPNVKYAELFKELYEEAREQKRGLWKDETEMGENRTYENKLNEFYNELDELMNEDFSDEEKTFHVFNKLGEAMSDKIIEMQYDEEGNLISNEGEGE